jgi:hypothetical protein
VRPGFLPIRRNERGQSIFLMIGFAFGRLMRGGIHSLAA